jgi:DNA-directed RNA polymerase subunit beta'
MGILGGEVTSTKFFTNKQKNIDEEGLLSESIFGPLKNYTCKCGKLKLKSLDAGKLCEKCNVFCESSDMRIKIFGKITPVFPIIKPTRKKHIRKIIGNVNKYLFEPSKADVISTTSRYLIISMDNEKIKVIEDLSTLDQNNWYLIPLRITGIYSFILAIKFAAYKLNIKIAEEILDKYVMHVIPVLPPDVRPVVCDPKKQGEIRFYETNKHYISLIGLNKHNEILREIKLEKELDWIHRINFNLENYSEDEVFDILIPDFDMKTAKYQYYTDELYNTVFSVISGKEGFIRSSILGKTIEFSARAVITIDPSLPPYKIKVSKKILYKLWYPYFINYLSRFEEDNYVKIFDNIVSTNFEDNVETFNRFLKWFCSGELFIDSLEVKEVEDQRLSADINNIIRLRRIEQNLDTEDF